jgi:hypothetical protein
MTDARKYLRMGLRAAVRVFVALPFLLGGWIALTYRLARDEGSGMSHSEGVGFLDPTVFNRRKLISPEEVEC